MMSDDDNDGQMIFGDLGDLKLPDICLTGEGKTQKTSPRKPVPTGDRTRARCVTGEHADAWPTAVDPKARVFVKSHKAIFIWFTKIKGTGTPHILSRV